MVTKSLSIGLGLFLIVMGIKKISGNLIVFELIEIYTGLKHADPAGRWITALLEIIAGSLLLTGKRVWGGTLAMTILVMALLFHVSVIGVFAPNSTAENAPKSPILFSLALIAFIIASYITVRQYLDENPHFLTLGVE